jgi:hypothetical protein
VSGDTDIDAWLEGLGLTNSEAKSAARQWLEGQKLTRAGKSRMSDAKLPTASRSLAEHFFLHCAQTDCATAAAESGRVPVTCDRSHCHYCGGSDNQKSVEAFVTACARVGIARIVVVGGSPSTRQEFERLVGARLELRLIDGTKARSHDKARGDVAWANLVVLWGASELHHKVSTQYQAAQTPDCRLVHVPKRGIAQLLAGVTDLLAR